MEFPTAGGGRFADEPPPHGDPLAVVRDALLSQLQHDRLRQEIIVAKLAKIERAMALRDASPSPSPSPSPTPRHSAGKTAASQTWSCAVCEVQTNSERNLRDHYGGQKHQSKVAELESKARTTTVKTTAKPSPVTGQKAHATRWSCSICQVDCNGEWHFDTHLKGKRHQANTQALLEQSNKNSGNSESHDGTKAQPSHVSHHAEKKKTKKTKKKKKEEEEEATWICRACQAHCTCESDLQNHLMGKRHQLNVQKGVTSDGSSFTSATSEMMDEQKALYFCKVCSLKCTSERMLAYHLSGKKHLKQEKLQAFCEICKLQCNSEKMLADHRCGKKHQAKLKKVLQAKFNAMECNVSDLAF